jgi:hypothetical protein
MNLDLFLAPADAARATRTLQSLARHDISRLALTGGFAIELQICARGGYNLLRPLHDIDFLVDAFDAIPPNLAADLLLRHIHPHDPPAKTLLQAVDPATSVRLDIFRAYGREMGRTEPTQLAGVPLRITSVEDLTARHARLCWDLIDGHPLAPKHARDFLRLLALVTPDAIEPVWQEHRKPAFAPTFVEAAQEIRRAIERRSGLLIPPVYSTDIHAACERCHATPAFPLAPAQQILSHLGYC